MGEHVERLEPAAVEACRFDAKSVSETKVLGSIFGIPISRYTMGLCLPVGRELHMDLRRRAAVDTYLGNRGRKVRLWFLVHTK